MEYFPSSQNEEQYILYDSLNQNLLLLNSKNRIKVIRPNLKIKFFKGKYFKIFKNFSEMMFPKSPYELQILNNISNNDFYSGIEVKIPKRKIVDFEPFGTQGKLIVASSDGGLFMYSKAGIMVSKYDLFPSIKKKKEYCSSVSACPKSKFVAAATCGSFPSSKSTRENIYFLKITGNNFILLNKIEVISPQKSSLFYSLRFYPRYVNKKPLVYAMENNADGVLCCYSLEETHNKVNVLKIEVEGFHNASVWGLKDDGNSLWSIDDGWCLKNLVVEEF